MTLTLTEDVQWSRRTFDSLRSDGGIWGYPNAGLVYQRRGEELVLTARMPFQRGMASFTTPAEWAEVQEREHQLVVEHFALAGITVREEER